MVDFRKYDLTLHQVLTDIDTLVDDPVFIRLFLATIAGNMSRAQHRMERAEKLLRTHGHNDAHRPITYRLIDQMEADISILDAIAKAMKDK